MASFLSMKPASEPWRRPRIMAAMAAAALAGAVSVILIAKTLTPYLVATLPRLSAAVRSWLVPPYLFATVHLIILIIWKLSDHKTHRPDEDKSPDPPLKPMNLDRNPSPELHKISESETPMPDSLPESGGSHVPEPDFDENCVDSSPSLEIKNAEAVVDEDDSMEARWKAIMKGGAVPVVKFTLPDPEQGQEDHLNQRFDAFIKKNYDQIRI